MKLKAIEKPNTLALKVVYWIVKRKFGKVIAPANVIYSRSIPILMVSNKIAKTDNKLSLPSETVLLIRNFIAHLNHCSWCSDLQEYHAKKNDVDFQKVKELMMYKQSTHFTDKEKAVLSYVEEATATKSVTDDTFTNLASYFNEKEIVEITWVNATENYYNLLAKPLGLSSDNLK